MKKISKLILLFPLLFITINITIAYFNTNDDLENNILTKGYKIDLNANGGEFLQSTELEIFKSKTTLPEPIRNGYNFIGFSETSDGEVKYPVNINNIDDINNKNLYAKWNIVNYTITYNLDGGSISGQPNGYNIEDSINIPNPTKDGFVFLGWTGTGLSTPTKDLIISNSTGNKTYTANWERVKYSITYNLNGGSISGQPTNYNVGDTITIPNPIKNAYTFVGWTGTDLPTPTKNLIIANASGDMSFTANWTPTNYTISYNLNGGTITGQPTTYNIESNITIPNPTKVGFNFTGWTGSGLTSPTKNLKLNNTSGNKSYTANWEVINYNITYDLNGGSISGQPTTYNINSNITLPQPTRTGYTFSGWTGTGLNTPTKNVIISNGTGNRNYTANWTPNVYYTVDINSIIQNVTYDSGLSGFTFSVWLDGTLVGDHVTDYYNSSLTYGQKLRVYVYDREGYSVTSFRDNTWTITSSFNINPTWYDNIAPTIVDFQVTNLGYYNPSLGAKGGFNVYIYIDAYDNGTGINKFQTWLVPYLNGSGSGRKDGQERTIKQVLYIEEPSGRTFCAYAIDNAGNEAERCATLHINE